MLLRRLTLVLLSLASLASSSFSMMRPGALDPPVPGGAVIINIDVRPPLKVCKGAQESIAISYYYVLTPLSPLGKGALKTEVATTPPPVGGSGKASVTRGTGDINPSSWDVIRLTGVGSKEFTYTAKYVGKESITFQVWLNGATFVTQGVRFEVIDCTYHTTLVASVVTGRGGGQFSPMTQVAIWVEEGDFTTYSISNYVNGSGQGYVQVKYLGAAMGATCVPTDTYEAISKYAYQGSLDKQGLHLGFIFDPLSFLPKTPIKCTVLGRLALIPNQYRSVDLNSIPIAKTRLYKDMPVEYWFKWYKGDAVLIITKIGAKAQP